MFLYLDGIRERRRKASVIVDFPALFRPTKILNDPSGISCFSKPLKFSIVSLVSIVSTFILQKWTRNLKLPYTNNFPPGYK